MQRETIQLRESIKLRQKAIAGNLEFLWSYSLDTVTGDKKGMLAMTDINTIRNLRSNHDKSINHIARKLDIN